MSSPVISRSNVDMEVMDLNLNGFGPKVTKIQISEKDTESRVLGLRTLENPSKDHFENESRKNGGGSKGSGPDYEEVPYRRSVSPILSSERRWQENLEAIIGLRDICGNDRLWKMLLGEFIGTMFLVLVGCGACLAWEKNEKPGVVRIALAFGIIIATMAQAIGHVSGCHLNPAVSVGLLVARQMSILKALLYIPVQCLGAIAGSALLQVVTPVEIQGNLGITDLHEKMEPVQGMFLEALITSVLVLTVCGVCDNLRSDIKGSAPLAIGLAVAVCHLMAIHYTGSSMNPARSLGPAVITKIWSNHWVYWAGPMLGAVAAGFVYQVGFLESRLKDQ